MIFLIDHNPIILIYKHSKIFSKVRNFNKNNSCNIFKNYKFKLKSVHKIYAIQIYANIISNEIVK